MSGRLVESCSCDNTCAWAPMTASDMRKLAIRSRRDAKCRHSQNVHVCASNYLRHRWS
jgi:hypothetical protein